MQRLNLLLWLTEFLKLASRTSIHPAWSREMQLVTVGCEWTQRIARRLQRKLICNHGADSSTLRLALHRCQRKMQLCCFRTCCFLSVFPKLQSCWWCIPGFCDGVFFVDFGLSAMHCVIQRFIKWSNERSDLVQVKNISYKYKTFKQVWVRCF